MDQNPQRKLKRQDFRTTSSNKQLNFLQHINTILKWSYEPPADTSLYADILEKKYKRRPAIFLTNGFETHILDGQYPERKCACLYPNPYQYRSDSV